jgi:hypothetical protein
VVAAVPPPPLPANVLTPLWATERTRFVRTDGVLVDGESPDLMVS